MYRSRGIFIPRLRRLQGTAAFTAFDAMHRGVDVVLSNKVVTETKVLVKKAPKKGLAVLVFDAKGDPPNEPDNRPNKRSWAGSMAIDGYRRRDLIGSSSSSNCVRRNKYWNVLKTF